jgi:hypothetical protein
MKTISIISLPIALFILLLSFSTNAQTNSSSPPIPQNQISSPNNSADSSCRVTPENPGKKIDDHKAIEEKSRKRPEPYHDQWQEDKHERVKEFLNAWINQPVV